MLNFGRQNIIIKFQFEAKIDIQWSDIVELKFSTEIENFRVGVNFFLFSS